MGLTFDVEVEYPDKVRKCGATTSGHADDPDNIEAIGNEVGRQYEATNAFPGAKSITIKHIGAEQRKFAVVDKLKSLGIRPKVTPKAKVEVDRTTPKATMVETTNTTGNGNPGDTGTTGRTNDVTDIEPPVTGGNGGSRSKQQK